MSLSGRKGQQRSQNSNNFQHSGEVPDLNEDTKCSESINFLDGLLCQSKFQAFHKLIKLFLAYITFHFSTLGGEALKAFMTTVDVNLNPKPQSRSWSTRNSDLDRDWKAVLDTLVKDYCTKSSFQSMACNCCKQVIESYAIQCNCCKAKLCCKCDEEKHLLMPFHDRWKTIKEKWINLLPNEFLDQAGQIITKGVIHN